MPGEGPVGGRTGGVRRRIMVAAPAIMALAGIARAQPGGADDPGAPVLRLRRGVLDLARRALGMP